MVSKEILASFHNTKCVVTGGTGLIGRPLVDILVKAGAEVDVVSLDDIEPNSGAIYHRLDLRNFDRCQMTTKNVDFCFHLAGVKGSIEVTKSKPASFLVPLLQFNTNILEACRLNNVKGVVYTSSIGAYASAEEFVEGVGDDGPPMDMYPGWAKRMAEMQIQAYKGQYGLKNYTVVRPCNVYGPGDNFDPDNAMVIPSLMCKIARGDNPVEVWGDGSAIRDFAYSRDVAEGILLAMFYHPDVPYLNLGSGVGHSIAELLGSLGAATVPFVPHFDTTKGNGYPRRVMNIDLARKLIGYDPTTSLYDGLKETWDWFMQNRDEYSKRNNYFKEK
jgi:GDP-L-fucose synthase